MVKDKISLNNLLRITRFLKRTSLLQAEMVLLLAGQQELPTNNQSITSKPAKQIGRGSKPTTASISNQVAAMSTMKSQSKEPKSRRSTEAERQEQPAATSDSEDRALKNRRSQSRTASPKMSLPTTKARRRSPVDAALEAGQLEGAT